MKTLIEYAQMAEEALQKCLPAGGGVRPGDIPPLLNEAMRYSLLAGGKRLRPAMLLAAVDMLGGDVSGALEMACAAEMIHTYSLIHDDLPGMDDDVLRRGRATCHVRYGVGQAILAGDGLLSFAFERMLHDALSHPEDMQARVRAMDEIARGAGVRGMVAGQCVDLQCERDAQGGRGEFEYIQHHKTACMFIYPLRAAAHLARAGAVEMAALSHYGAAFGCMFQTVDDLLDVEGDSAALGKSVGKDAKEGKLTAVSLHGLEGARALADEYLHAATEALSPFGPRADFFRALIEGMRGRRS